MKTDSAFRRGKKGKGAVELMEEAVSLVRRASAEDLSGYLLGVLPFILYLLYFIDRRTGASGADRLLTESFILALLYIWMKYRQSVFAARLMARLRNTCPGRSRTLGALTSQAALQPWGLLCIPLAALLTVPFGWCYAFFQNVTVFGSEGDTAAVFRNACRHSLLFPAQNLLVILIAFVMILIIFMNICAAAVMLPIFLKKLLGIETAFSRSAHFFFNTSFLAFLVALACMCVDPFLKAAYVLRCHYGQCVETGADLLSELREIRRKTGKTVAVFAGALSLLTALAVTPSMASSGIPDLLDPKVAAIAADAGELDRAIADVMKRPEFSWPSSRIARQHEKQSIPGFPASILSTLKGWAKQVGKWIRDLFQWIAEHMKPSPKTDSAGRGGDRRPWTIPVVMLGLCAILLSVCGVMLWRRFSERRRALVPPPSGDVPSVPDLRDEAVTPDELTVEGWRRLAEELLAQGEARLAIRALYFASIAHLDGTGVLVMDRAKSDRDYERELARRAHSTPLLLEAFSGNVSLFQRVWYGMYSVDGAMLDAFVSNCARISAHAR